MHISNQVELVKNILDPIRKFGLVSGIYTLEMFSN